MDIYEMSSYLDILENKIEENSSVKGYKSILAKAARCQPSFLSNVLAGRAHFSDEQAASLCEFWEFSDTAIDYFIALLHWERAGTEILRQKYKRELRKLRLESRNHYRSRTFGKRLNVELSGLNHQYYLSNWYIPAIHYATLLPEMNSIERIARHFCLEEKLVELILNKLEELNLVRRTDDTWIFHSAVSLDIRDPVMGRITHLAMRARANQKYENRQELDIFKTIWLVLSEDELASVRQLLGSFFEKMHARISEPAPPHKLLALCVDFFEI